MPFFMGKVLKFNSEAVIMRLATQDTHFKSLELALAKIDFEELKYICPIVRDSAYMVDGEYYRQTSWAWKLKELDVCSEIDFKTCWSRSKEDKLKFNDEIYNAVKKIKKSQYDPLSKKNWSF
jgi:hypothetical protein